MVLINYLLLITIFLSVIFAVKLKNKKIYVVTLFLIISEVGFFYNTAGKNNLIEENILNNEKRGVGLFKIMVNCDSLEIRVRNRKNKSLKFTSSSNEIKLPVGEYSLTRITVIQKVDSVYTWQYNYSKKVDELAKFTIQDNDTTILDSFFKKITQRISEGVLKNGKNNISIFFVDENSTMLTVALKLKAKLILPLINVVDSFGNEKSMSAECLCNSIYKVTLPSNFKSGRNINNVHVVWPKFGNPLKLEKLK